MIVMPSFLLLWSRQVIREALLDGHAVPSDVSALEMHGTGTPLGDPIEMGAATAVFCADERGEWMRPTCQFGLQ